MQNFRISCQNGIIYAGSYVYIVVRRKFKPTCCIKNRQLKLDELTQKI